MKVGRQVKLLRRMRRSLIALRMQTPEPVVHRVPVSLYFSMVVLISFFVVIASTRAALIYRSEVKALNARIVSVESTNKERKKVRMAALIAYQQQNFSAPKPKLLARVPAPVFKPETKLKKPTSILEPAIAKKSAEKRTTVIINTSQAERTAPKNVEQALFRLQQGKDDLVLRWLVENPDGIERSPAWETYRHRVITGRSAEQFYQLGVLYGALGNHEKSLHWIGSAVELDDQARYLRAYAVSADRQGLQKKAIAAYLRYLSAPQARDSIEIRARIARLEKP